MREEKKYLLTEVQDTIDHAPNFLVIQYTGMRSGKNRDFRNQIASAEGLFEIVKKRVFAKAVEKYNIKLDVDDLTGHVGVLFAEDHHLLSVAKSAYKYAQDNEGVVEFLCGHVQGSPCSKEDIKALATLPSIDELRAQIVGVLEAPMRETIGVVQSLLTSLLYCLEQKENKENSN